MFMISKVSIALPSFMFDEHLSTGVFQKNWGNCIGDPRGFKFNSQKDAEKFITNVNNSQTNKGAILLPTSGCVDIIEVDNQLNFIIVKSVPLALAGTVGVNVQPTHTKTYDKPGEALKAYRQGKFVDWKKLANKNS